MKKKDNINEKEHRKKGLIGRCKLFFKNFFLENDFFCNKIVAWILVLNLIANIIDWILLAFLINRIDEKIILHYNVYFGVDAVGRWRDVFIFPLIGIILFILNSVLAYYFYNKKERVTSYILVAASFMAQLSLIIASISIIIINY